MIIEILHDQPDKTGKLEAHADDFTAVGTLTDLTVLWKKFCNLGSRFGCYLQTSRSWLIVTKVLS